MDWIAVPEPVVWTLPKPGMSGGMHYDDVDCRRADLGGRFEGDRGARRVWPRHHPAHD